MPRPFIVLTALFIVAPSLIAAPPTSQPRPAQPRPAPSPFNQMIPQVQFSNNKLSDVIEYLHDVSNANILIDEQALKDAGLSDDTPITLSVQNKTVHQVLDLVCAKISKDNHKIVNGPVGFLDLISSPPLLLRARKQNDADAAKATDANNLKHIMLDCKFNSVPLSDVLQFLHEVSNVKLNIDWNALQSAGISKTVPISLALKNLPTYQTLRLILNQAQSQSKSTLNFTASSDNTITIAPAKPPT